MYFMRVNINSFLSFLYETLKIFFYLCLKLKRTEAIKSRIESEQYFRFRS